MASFIPELLSPSFSFLLQHMFLWLGREALPDWALARTQELRLIPFREFLTLHWPKTAASGLGCKIKGF